MPTKPELDQQEICIPKGYRFASVASGIKPSGAKDVTLIVADEPSVAAGVYTRNVVRAASMDWNEAITPSDSVRAIVVTSGNANACTGETGDRNNASKAELSAKQLTSDTTSVNKDQVLVLATGIIGVQLPMDCVETGIVDAANKLADSNESFLEAAEGIRTSDQFAKVYCKQFSSGGNTHTISAMAKGAGMIGPRMATMLCIITTDFPLDSDSSQAFLTKAVDESFNRISVEGHTSTNDAVILLAPSNSKSSSAEEQAKFQTQLMETCLHLAKLIPSDGEGATHLVEIEVTGAEDDSTADLIARAIAASNLVKTAITGNDPNWGRIVSAIGILDVDVDVKKVGLEINGFAVFENGQPCAFSEQEVSRSMSENFETTIQLTVGVGTGSSIHWTSDLTVDYVRFNSEYTT